MKRSRFSEEQIIGILKEHEAGVSVADLCRKRQHLQVESPFRWGGDLGGQAAEDAVRREHAAETGASRRHARQRGLEGPPGETSGDARG
ncbi:transposase [Bradyrhizobium sp. CCBAU 21360]|uniref:transposase n=1 Tax=Bradyrhizobium sp. CCBAU 21360 TaxID=1325081 RepID=UPI003FA4BFF2